MSKIIFITGGTSGIGRLLIERFLEEKHHVIFTARNENKAQQTLSALKNRYPEVEIEYLCGDLLVTADVKRIAQELQNRIEKLDLLINNAGCYTHTRKVTEDGYEHQTYLHFLVPRFLSEVLLPLLEKSENGRIVNLTSRMHKRAKADHADFFFEHTPYSGFKAYALSKLLLTTYTFYFAKKNPKVSTVAVHPGVYATGITKELPPIIKKLWNTFISGPEMGAKIVSKIALHHRDSGVYFYKKGIAQPHPLAQDINFQEKIMGLKIPF